MFIMKRHIVWAVLLIAACSSRTDNFGGPADVGDTGRDAEHDANDAPRLAGIGETCTGPDQCVSEALCIGATAGVFRCMEICPRPYAICDSGAVCLPVMTQDAAICYEGGAGQTTDGCENNLGCAAGLLCFGASGEFYCRPACDETAGRCATAENCLRLASGAGLCRSAVGAACDDASDCEGDLTCSHQLDDVTGRFVGGYCTTTCLTDTDCPANARCRSLPGATEPICLQSCSHRSECRFNGSYGCLDATECGSSSDPAACQAMFGDDSLCVHGPF